ncbi:type I-E CRISPR-associated protein Cse2/CasB [Streptomyces sp. NPDC003717]|uniref:type I-E CRISPR-associated protein Cse2/CasB n=1 Tax=Streptomyces sp. NPDC003717 TaxID=3154276 RepID=UPI0033B817A4
MTDQGEPALPSARRGSDEFPLPAPHPAQRADWLASYDTFVRRTLALCRQPGAQQALRGGLAKPLSEIPTRTHAALLRAGLVPDEARGDRRRAYYAVAALIAARSRGERRTDEHPEHAAGADAAAAATETSAPSVGGPVSYGTSLGESLAQLSSRRLRQRSPSLEGPDQSTQRDNESKVSGVEARLHLLVRQDTEGLHRMLPAVARQLGSASLVLDYGRLLADVTRWAHARDDIAVNWLQDYYRTLRRAPTRDVTPPGA